MVDTTVERLRLEKINGLAELLVKSARSLDDLTWKHTYSIRSAPVLLWELLNINWLRFVLNRQIAALGMIKKLSPEGLQQAKLSASSLGGAAKKGRRIVAKGHRLIEQEGTPAITAFLLGALCNSCAAFSDSLEDTAETLALASSAQFKEMVLKELGTNA